jgi:ribosomal protein S27E
VSYIVIIFLVWVICAAVASAVAPRERQMEFFFLSLLILGPLGVGFAAVAMPREPVVVMPGRKRVVCPRCVAAQYVGNGVDVFTCWRCDQHVAVDDWGRVRNPSVGVASKPKIQAAAKPKATPTPTPAGKTTTVKCYKCQHTQRVPVSASTFQCEKCNAKLTRADKS